jgi:Glucose dehydrogenase
VADVASRLGRLGFSPLRQVTKQNVAELRTAWSWSLPNGPNEGTPLFHDGVLFVHAFGDKVQALDAVTGDLLWQYSRRLPMGVTPGVKRSIALYGDKVYTGTSDVHLVALDARTGRVVWDKEVADRTKGFSLTGGVTVAKGKVIASTTGRSSGGNLHRGFDANTGAEAWRFNTIPKENEPGGNTWNGVLMIGATAVRCGRPAATTRAATCLFRHRPDLRHRAVSQPRAGTEQRPALHRLDDRAEPGHGQAGVVFPAPAQRSVGYDWAFRPNAAQDVD